MREMGKETREEEKGNFPRGTKDDLWMRGDTQTRPIGKCSLKRKKGTLMLE